MLSRMSLRAFAVACAVAAGAGIWTAPGRAADLAGTPVPVPAEVAAVVEAVEAAAPAPVAVPAPVQAVEQVAAPVRRAVAATAAPVRVAPQTPPSASEPKISTAPRETPRAVVTTRRAGRAAAAGSAAGARAEGVYRLEQRPTASPPPSPAAARSSAPRRELPQLPQTPLGAAGLDTAPASALLLVLALALLFAATAAIEFAAPLRLAPQLLRPQRFATPLERPG